MLRQIKSPNRRARLIGFAATTTGASTNTVEVGSGEGTFTNSTEALTLTLREPFARIPVSVCTPGASVGVGGTAHLTGATTTTAVGTSTVNGSASADAGGVEALVLGYDSTITEVSAKKENLFENVSATFRNPILVAGQVSSAGAKLIGGSTFTVVRNGTGDYTVTFTRAFGRIPVVVATPFTNGASCHIASKTDASFNILTYDAANSAADVRFNFIAYGDASSFETRMIKGADVQIGFRKPRMFGGIVTYTAGVPAITVGTGLFTITDTGTGLLDVAFTERFAREPIVVASCMTAARWASLTGASSLATGCQIVSAGSTGTLTDPTAIHFIVVGSDDAVEY